MISRSQRDLDRLAARDLAIKLQIESAFRKDLKNYFRKVNRDFVNDYKQYGQVNPVDKNKDELRKLLLKYYKMINRKFGFQTRTNNLKFFKEIEVKSPQVEFEIQRQFDIYNETHSAEQADIISSTNKKEQQEYVQKIKADAAIAGYLLSDAEVAEQTGSLLTGIYDSRVDTIATTETQNVAENSKFIEASVISGIAAVGLLLMKRWVSVLDERTRQEHVDADGQEVAAFDPFLVGSDKLMKPGDFSLGAKPGNVINCRCGAVYFMKDL